MTQAEFIERVNELAGITFRNATLSSWENGQSSPTGDLIPVIAKILETPVTQLFSPEVTPVEPYPTSLVGEPEALYNTEINLELYRKIFANNPEETFNNLLEQYDTLLKTNSSLMAENQKLEGKLSATAEFLRQLMDLDMKKR